MGGHQNKSEHQASAREEYLRTWRFELFENIRNAPMCDRTTRQARCRLSEEGDCAIRDDLRTYMQLCARQRLVVRLVYRFGKSYVRGSWRMQYLCCKSWTERVVESRRDRSSIASRGHSHSMSALGSVGLYEQSLPVLAAEAYHAHTG